MSHGQLLHLNGLAMEKATPKFQNMSLCGTDPFHVRLRRKPLTETPRHGEKFLLGTPASSSASSLRSGFRSQVSAFSVVPHLGRIQSHRSRSGYRHGFERALGYSAGVVLCRGGDFRGHLRNQFLTSTSAWANLFLRPSTRSGKSASDIWTYCHKSIYTEAQKGRRLLNRRSS